MEKISIINKSLNRISTSGYLVGGFVRDLLLEKSAADIDLVIDEEVKEIAVEFARRTDGNFVVLDEKRKNYRVVVDEEIYDFSLLQGRSISEDLLRRDFTINACALPLTKKVVDELIAENCPEAEIIALESSRKDLEQGKIRATNQNTFTDDPLRLLRAVRFKAELGYEIVAETERKMQQAAGKLVTAAAERIKDELMKIFQAPQAAFNTAYLEEKFGVFSLLISDVSELKKRGQCKYHQEDIWTHSVYAVEKLEQLAADEFWAQRIKKDNWPLLKLGGVVHDIGKLLTEEVVEGKTCFYGHQKEGAPYVASILEQLAFSRREIKYMKTLVRYHMRPLNLYSAEDLTFKGKYRLFRAIEDWTPDVCLLAAADMLSTVNLNGGGAAAGSRQFLRDLVREREEQTAKTEPQLVSGNDIMDTFSVPEGPRVGELLAVVKEAQAAGKINTREEALNYLQEIIDNQG